MQVYHEDNLKPLQLKMTTIKDEKTDKAERAVIHMFGVTAEGNSVAVHVQNCMNDTEIGGKNWIKIQRGGWRCRYQKVSNCQIEIDVIDPSYLEYLPLKGDHGKIAPLRILSLDIECQQTTGDFTRPERDPIIQIASIVKIQG